MNIFVASRMKSVVERKAAIDVVHSLGHTPIFIEAEQMREGPQSKWLMDAMLKRSEGLIAIVDDHLGIPDDALEGMSPLQYEIVQFRQMAEARDRDLKKCMVTFIRTDFKDRYISNECAAATCALVGGKKYTFPYKDYDDLAVSVRRKVLECWQTGNPVSRPSVFIHIEYKGPDRSGIVGNIAELLYTTFRLNVTHVTGTVVDARASIVLVAEPWQDSFQCTDADRIKETLQMDFKDGEIVVRPGSGRGFASRLYFELRVLDVPGVLNALCKALTQLGMNIDDLAQRPAPRCLERQSTILLWLSSAIQDPDIDIREQHLHVETRLRNLVGVVSMSSDII